MKTIAESDNSSSVLKDVNTWWRARSSMKLVNENGQWRIEGEGSEHARVASAERCAEHIVYAGERGRWGHTVARVADAFDTNPARVPADGRPELLFKCCV